MATDTIQYTADASQAFDVINRLQTQMQNLETRVGSAGAGRAGDQIGEGFLRSERVVSRSSANIVSGLIGANDAASAVANALLQVEHAGKLGLGLAIGVAVGIAAFEALQKQINETIKVEEAFHSVTDRPIKFQAALSAADIGKQIEDQAKANEAQQERRESAGNVLGLIFAPITRPHSEEAKSTVGDFLAKQDAEAVAGSNKLIELIKDQAQAELKVVAVKELTARGSEREGALAKVQLDYEQKIASIRASAVDNPNLYAGLAAREQAAKRELALLQETINKRAFLAESNLIRETDLANDRGTPEQKTQHKLASDLAGAESKLKEENITGTLLEKEQAILEVAKARSAIYEHDVELKKQQIDLNFAGRETDVKVRTAKEEVNESPEARQRSGLDEQVSLSKLKIDRARELLALDSTDVGLQKSLTAALGEQSIAVANRAKFDKDKAFEHNQELKAAKAITAEMQAQAKGDASLAASIKSRESTEAKIASYIRDGKNDLAAQAAIQGKLAARDIAKKAITGGSEEQAKVRAATAEDQAFDQKVAYFQQQLARGVKFDQSDPTANAIKQYLATIASIDQANSGHNKPSADNPKAESTGKQFGPSSEDLGVNAQSQGQGDFSSVSSLAGQDFSSLASLANLNFSGLAALGNLSVI